MAVEVLKPPMQLQRRSTYLKRENFVLGFVKQPGGAGRKSVQNSCHTRYHSGNARGPSLGVLPPEVVDTDDQSAPPLTNHFANFGGVGSLILLYGPARGPAKSERWYCKVSHPSEINLLTSSSRKSTYSLWNSLSSCSISASAITC